MTQLLFDLYELPTYTMLRVIILYILVMTVSSVRDSFQWFRSRDDCRDVATESGLVRGCPVDKEDCISFLGVPYAAPPTGNNRFKAPAKPFSWKGVFEADRIVKCTQNGEGIEDCLVVNIFAPVKMFDTPLPVLVYIHGGSFLSGSGQAQGAESLVKQNIIVVTINYRLGPLGFLCLGNQDAPGNAGLKDQVAALQWVQRNIANFGGDPKQVTVYGMSAGAASVELLVLSKQGRDLFQRAIVESASATSVWATDLDPIKTARNFADEAGFPRNINTQMLTYHYQRMNAKKVSQVNNLYYNKLIDGTFGFAPCVENITSIDTSEAFLTEPPYDILTKGKYERVPMMFLYATLEGLYLRSKEFYQQNYKERMSTSFLGFMPADLDFDTDEIRNAIAENIHDFYFGNKTIGDDIVEYLNYFGDYLIMHGLLNSAEIHSMNQNPVYLMEFAYKGNLGSYEKFYDNINTAGHGDVIKHAILNKQPQSTQDKLAVARVTKLVANFVKFGNPTPERTQLLPILWPRVQPGNVSCLYMDEDFDIIDEPHWDRKEFWDQLYSKYRKRPKRVNPFGG